MRLLLIMPLLILTLLYSASNLSSQSASLNFRGGLNLSNVSFDGPNLENTSGEILTGFHLGAFVELPISNKFGLETGLLLQNKGYKTQFEADFLAENGIDTISIAGDRTIRLLYLDVPILFKSRFEIGKMNVFASAGPYFGFGLNGTDFYEYVFEDEPVEQEAVIDWGNNGDFKSVDYGVMASVGVEFSGLIVSASYMQGLANIEAGNPDEFSIQHQIISISLGFRLGEE
ncbi:MAG: outer membrane beta-barrel protein [Bacteroidetes bacterium]|nr:outer membrane beta-barrel protein [Bacteroidota bacterium]